MLIKRMKKRVYWVVVIISIFLIFENILIKRTYASRKNEDLFRMMDKMDAREVEIYDNVFYVHTNQDEKFILIRGMVSNWEEMKKVEEYFILRSPSTYSLTFDIDIDFAQ